MTDYRNSAPMHFLPPAKELRPPPGTPSLYPGKFFPEDEAPSKEDGDRESGK